MQFGTYDLEQLVSKDHELRKINRVIDFTELTSELSDLETDIGRKGYGADFAVRSMFLQFLNDFSDRQMMKHLRDNFAFRWFCGLSLNDETPAHSYFGRMRAAIGTKRIGNIFENIKAQARGMGHLRGVFTFVDATTIKAKEATWKERDQALEKGEEKLNNENVQKYSADKDARFGCKGNEKFWFGYKRSVALDMGCGLISKVAVTPANVPDWEALKHVVPKEGMVFGDKAYGIKPARLTIEANGCVSGAILKDNVKGKDFRRDKWLTKIRMPFEGVFSQRQRRSRYRGHAKNQLQGFMESIVFNIKRLVVLQTPPILARA